MKPSLRVAKNSRESSAKSRLTYFEKRRGEMVATIRELVELESPSDNKLAADRLAGMLGGKFAALGGRVRMHPAREFGNHVQADFPGGLPETSGGKPILLLGHYDTVYPLGTLAAMPCRVRGDKLTGPGVLDMKTGIALMLQAIAALQGQTASSGRERRMPRPVTVFLVSDEEVGSESSRAITEALAKKSAAVLVLEPSLGPKGAVKTARKGVGEYEIKVTGRAAHSGLDFAKGVNAIVELSKQIEKITGFTRLKNGVTVNVGIVRGGSRVNVVPAEAVAQFDVRIPRLRDAAGIDTKMRSLRPFNRRCTIEVIGGINRPPMERTAGVAALYSKAVAIASDIGFKLTEAAVGGGSDGNFTAALGIPTLDGLGAIGDGAHAPHEHIIISELPRRAALIAALIDAI